MIKLSGPAARMFQLGQEMITRGQTLVQEAFEMHIQSMETGPVEEIQDSPEPTNNKPIRYSPMHFTGGELHHWRKNILDVGGSEIQRECGVKATTLYSYEAPRRMSKPIPEDVAVKLIAALQNIERRRTKALLGGK